MQPTNAPKIAPSSSAIRKKIGNKVNMRDIFTPEKLKECEAIIEKAHTDFLQDALDIWKLIINNFAELTANPDESHAIIKKIADNSLAIKGKLDAVGYGLGMKIAKSLNEFATNDTSPQKHMVIYGKHIDAMNTVIRANLKGDGGAIGTEMTQALSALIKKLA